MRVLFPDTSNPKTGKGFFIQALSQELPKIGVEIASEYDPECDVIFENIRVRNPKSRKPIVVRFDGVYHNTAMNWQAKNETIAEAARLASGIVCQSEFGKRMVLEYLKADESKITVINNGSNPYTTVTKPEFKNEHNFLAVAVWRPHKRLEDTIKAFLLADVKDAVLRIFGKLGKGMDTSILKYNSNKVIFMEHVTDRAALHGYYKYSTALIHLCWTDCCPNSVVEAICQKCPVICNNEGGTHEIVRPSGGIVLDIDNPYDLKPTDLYNPPPVDLNKIAEAIVSVSKNRPQIKNEHVDIHNIAQQYKKKFEMCL